MNFSDANLLFVSLATKRGFAVIRERLVIMIRKRDVCLQLRPTDSGVTLEISHGPIDGPLGWLDLYSDPNGPDSPSLENCIEYGLDLFDPNQLPNTQRDA